MKALAALCALRDSAPVKDCVARTCGTRTVQRRGVPRGSSPHKSPPGCDRSSSRAGPHTESDRRRQAGAKNTRYFESWSATRANMYSSWTVCCSISSCVRLLNLRLAECNSTRNSSIESANAYRLQFVVCIHADQRQRVPASSFPSPLCPLCARLRACYYLNGCPMGTAAP